MIGRPPGGKGHHFRAVSIRKIENGWLSSTTTGDETGAKSIERFHAKKPDLGVGLRAGAAAAAKKAPASRPKRAPAGDTYRDPAQRPK